MWWVRSDGSGFRRTSRAILRDALRDVKRGSGSRISREVPVTPKTGLEVHDAGPGAALRARAWPRREPAMGTKLAMSSRMDGKRNIPSEGVTAHPSIIIIIVFALLLSPLSAASVALPDNIAGPGIWRWLGSSGGGAGEAFALAQSRSGEIAVGDDAGVTWWQNGERHRTVLSSVRDLVFDAENVLWIATDLGLFSWNRNGRPLRKRLLGGETGNRVARIVVSDSSLLLATGGGALWSSDGKIFQRIGTSAATAISHVAIRSASFDRTADGSAARRAGVAQAWIYGARGLSVVRGLESASGLRVTGVDTLAIPLSLTGSSDEKGVVDLVIDPEGRRLFLIFQDSIIWRSIEEADSSSASVASEPFGVSQSSWHHERPTLPPGTSIRGLGWAAGRIWIATDHGLLSADTFAEPFRRAASPVGTTRCVDVQARAPAHTLALCRTGIFVLGPASSVVALANLDGVRSRPRSRPFELLSDPPLPEVRRRALRRSGLTVGRADSMWKRLRRRAYWPEVQLSFDVELDSDRQRDFDQAFISGDRRFLVDRTRDEGQGYRATIELDWDLASAVFPDETVDVSRELRQIITLRDDVVDEINQLYFERQAIRATLTSAHLGAGEDVARLTWRARELDAGLDAWTGGWISRWRSQPPPVLDSKHGFGPNIRPEKHHPNHEE